MYSDYYHKKYSINDKELGGNYPLSKDDEKIKIGWNLGVIRYDYLNNINALKKIFYKNISFKKFQKYKKSILSKKLLKNIECFLFLTLISQEHLLNFKEN